MVKMIDFLLTDLHFKVFNFYIWFFHCFKSSFKDVIVIICVTDHSYLYCYLQLAYLQIIQLAYLQNKMMNESSICYTINVLWKISRKQWHNQYNCEKFN